MAKGTAEVAQRSHLEALLKLSDVRRGITPQELETLIRKSPDPATAIQAVVGNLLSASPALVDKWHKTLRSLWASYHPDVPSLPDIPVTKQQATGTFLLLDALSLLDSVSHKSAHLITRRGETVLDARDQRRLTKALESLEGENLSSEQTPSSLARVKRLIECLTTARLLRTYRDELQVVRSRLKAFLRLPRSYQWYVLWHTDAYHVCWGEFAQDWHEELRVVQDYLPLLWDVSDATSFDTSVDKHTWCLQLIEAFAPIWAEEGLVHSRSQWPLLSLVHQSALPAVINQVIINDLLARYGLIQFERSGNFVWTPLGISLLEAERNHELPCGLELIS